jgi:hypothetical protein
MPIYFQDNQIIEGYKVFFFFFGVNQAWIIMSYLVSGIRNAHEGTECGARAASGKGRRNIGA